MDELIKLLRSEAEQKQSKATTDAISNAELGTALTEWTAARTIELISSAGIRDGRTNDEHYRQTAKLLKHITQLSAEMVKGDMNEAERMLFSQAKTLEATASQFLSMAAQLMHRPQQCDRYAQLGLRAQDQCRKTLLALYELKNPKKPTQFIKSYVDKQVNQLRVDQNSQPEPNVLEASKDAPVDFGSATATGREDQAMETVAAVHRPQDSHRKSRQCSECP